MAPVSCMESRVWSFRCEVLCKVVGGEVARPRGCCGALMGVCVCVSCVDVQFFFSGPGVERLVGGAQHCNLAVERCGLQQIEGGVRGGVWEKGKY